MDIEAIWIDVTIKCSESLAAFPFTMSLKTPQEHPQLLLPNLTSLSPLIHLCKIITSGTFDPGLHVSGHCLIYGIINLQRNGTPPKYILAKNYKQVNIEKLKHAFTTAPWSAIEAFGDSDDITLAWENGMASV